MKRKTSLLAAGALALALAGCGDDDPKTVADDPGSGHSSKATPKDDATEPTDATTTPSDANTTTVPVYFVGPTPQGPRLFREFRRVEADNPLSEAAALLTAGDTQDPDYESYFPVGSGSFKDVRYDEATDTIVAEVRDNKWFERPGDMTANQGRLAVQQLVYTLQGVQQDRVPVRVELDGGPAPLFGIDTTQGTDAAPQLDVLGLVNVTTPEEAQQVSGTFTADGVASSFEATVPWEIRQGDEVVKKGFATATGWMDKLYPWHTDVDVSGLEPGEYTFVAMTDDPSDGEGAGPTEDTKTIIVQ